ncbi:MAG: hypothetical protein AB1671_05585 [Thermodesulfobacteriota bacterium]
MLILCRHRGCKIVLAEYVRGEVEENLLALFASDSRLADEIIDTYDRLLRLLKPEAVPQPTKEQIDQHAICSVIKLTCQCSSSPCWHVPIGF